MDLFSKTRYNDIRLTRPAGQAVKTLPSQGKIMGSIPIGGATKQNDCVLFFYLSEMSTSEILRKFRFPRRPSLRHLFAF